MRTRPKRTIQIMVDPVLYDEIEKQRGHESRSSFVRRLIEQGLGYPVAEKIQEVGGKVIMAGLDEIDPVVERQQARENYASTHRERWKITPTTRA